MSLTRKQKKIWTVISIICTFFLVASSFATALLYSK